MLSKEEAALYTLQRMISPAWTSDMLLANLEFAEKLCGILPFFRLRCTKEESAAATMKYALDNIL